jgi:hypothetical protein
MIHAYGLDFPDGTTPATVELFCFAHGWAREQSGLTRFQHYRNAVDLLYNFPRRVYAAERKMVYDPDKNDLFIWNEWTELVSEQLCLEKEVLISGPGASWKSTAVALYADMFWLSSPNNTRVVCTSTTSDALRAKFWKEVMHFYRAANAGVGHPVPSRTIIQYQKGDDGAGIYGVAVESDGSVERAVNKIVGRHNTNIFVAVDELATVSEAIVEASVNLETGAEHFQFAGMANPDSKFDPHGRMSEPENGWNSITDETQMWRTKRGGVAIHLDGRRSPRIRDDDKFPGMIRQRDLDRTAEIYGENSPQFWKQRVGFWCPEGITKTVLSETMIQKFRAMEKIGAGPISWVNNFVQAAVLDPSFEGQDRKVLRFPKWGDVTDTQKPEDWSPLQGIKSRKAIDLGEYMILKVDVTLPEPIHYQIVRRVKQACETRGIPPELFALDSTGEGGGLASIFAREWSPLIVQVEFGGRASERPVSEINPRTCREEYYNRVAELWFAVRTMMQNNQVYRLDKDTAVEFCKRLWEMRGNMIMVETKTVMKARVGKSPDLADSAAIACELFRQKEDLSISGIAPQADDAWEQFVKKNSLNDPQAYLVA